MSKELEAARALVKMLEEKENAGKVELSTLKLGEVFELVGLKWKILDITEEGYVCLADCLKEEMQFDSACNNWRSSDLRNYLNTEFFNMLVAEIGVGNIIPFKRNLLSLDGQTEYGVCEDKVSLLTVGEYIKYEALITNANYCWWTITPDNTKYNDDTRWVRVVSLCGSFYDDGFHDRSYNCNYGVRPFCILKSNIFVTKAKG